MNKDIMRAAGLGAWVDRIEDQKCPFCEDPDWDFRDLLSAQECRISGLCQACQDKVFVPAPKEDD